MGFRSDWVSKGALIVGIRVWKSRTLFPMFLERAPVSVAVY